MPTWYQNLRTKTCSLRLRAFTPGLTPGVLSPISDSCAVCAGLPQSGVTAQRPPAVHRGLSPSYWRATVVILLTGGVHWYNTGIPCHACRLAARRSLTL